LALLLDNLYGFSFANSLNIFSKSIKPFNKSGIYNFGSYFI